MDRDRRSFLTQMGMIALVVPLVGWQGKKTEQEIQMATIQWSRFSHEVNVPGIGRIEAFLEIQYNDATDRLNRLVWDNPDILDDTIQFRIADDVGDEVVRRTYIKGTNGVDNLSGPEQIQLVVEIDDIGEIRKLPSDYSLEFEFG